MEKPKILIIDDDAGLCESLVDILELQDYLADSSHTAADGLIKVESGFYNIVLLDMKLPDSDGIDVLGKIKAISPDTEVIIFTAYSNMKTVIRAMDRDAFSFIPKPFDTPYLLTNLKRSLEKQETVLKIRTLYKQTINEKREWEETFDSIADLITIHDNDFKVIRCNKAVIEKLDVEFGDIVGKKCHEIFHGRNEPWPTCPFVRCKESLKPEMEEEECMGGVFQMSCFPRFDAEGKFSGIVHIARDITKRKKAEIQISMQSTILHAINKIFKEALTCDTEEEVAKTSLVMAQELTDSKFGFYGEINNSGLFDTIAMSDPGWDACRIPETDAVVLINNMKIHGIYGSILKGEKSQIVNDTGSHPDRIGLPEGHPPLTSFLGVPLKQAGKTIGMIALANKEGSYTPDDQEAIEALSGAFVEALMSKRAESELLEKEEKLRISYKMASLGRLTSGVFHELLNPVNIISSHVQLLLMEAEKGSATEKDLKSIQEEIKRIVKISDGLLRFARKGETGSEQIKINDLLENIISIVEPDMKLEEVIFNRKFDDRLPQVTGSSDQLRQVFLNLITNARDAMPEGGTITVKTRIVQSKEFRVGSLESGVQNRRAGEYKGDFIEISFADTGCGISKENQEMVFDPFFTTKEDGKGTGLGLSTSYGIIEDHGGIMSVESEVGKGTTFTIDLPVKT